MRKKEDEYVQVLFARSLVLCFGPGLGAHGMYYLRLRTTSFGFFPDFVTCFQGENYAYDSNNAAYG